ncbi:TRAP transporter substrate-binding protein [Siminovitchia sediminis]|uniref:TRAP transporter substrate-binding protein n=1 Tax=Siminovitchia sediminis TaxID=1274353 RepID=A0ABW4KLD1_9BACI
MRKLRILIVAMVFLMIVTMAGCGTNTESSGSGKDITLTYAFFAPENSFPAVQMKKWAEELSDRTNGQIQVDLFPGGTLLEASNMFDGVKNGTADIGMSATSYEPARFPLLTISDLPSSYPNASVASRTVYDLIQEYPPEAFKDFKIIAAFTTEPAYVQTIDKVENTEDLKGKNLRIAGSLSDIAKKLNASPVAMSQSEVPEAIQTGVLDGYITSREVLKDFHLAESIKYVVDYPLHVTTFVAVMNKDTWESLPSDVQQVIDELGSEMAIFTGEYHDQNIQESLEWSKEEHGTEMIQLSPEEQEKWDQAIKPIQDEYVKKLEKEGLPAKEYRDRLYELIEKYSSE